MACIRIEWCFDEKENCPKFGADRTISGSKATASGRQHLCGTPELTVTSGQQRRAKSSRGSGAELSEP
jgi:hypothetical protein